MRRRPHLSHDIRWCTLMLIYGLARIQRVVTGVEPPEKSAQKFLSLPFCCTVEHVQLKNVTDDVTNII